LRKQLWGGKFWADGYFVRSVGDSVTAEIIKRYIRYQGDSDKPRQLELWD
jgi:putative transposase